MFYIVIEISEECGDVKTAITGKSIRYILPLAFRRSHNDMDLQTSFTKKPKIQSTQNPNN